MATERSISRREIKSLIAEYEKRASPDKGWYQNIEFLPWLETRRSKLETLSARLRGVVRKEELVISHMPGFQSAKVIDIGCNAGLYSLEASCRGARFVLGVDRSPIRIQQAMDVANVFRRLGRPVGHIQFKRVDDINNHLSLLRDKDVLIACCVLYHLGPLDRFKAAVQNSAIRTLVLQGNLARVPTAEANGANRPAAADEVASLAGLRAFCSSLGFTVVKGIEHEFPLAIAVR